MPTVASLTAEFRADTRDLERGGQVARKELQATEEQAKQTARALEIMAEAASKANPGQGTAAQVLAVFQRANVQPTATALAQAAKEMDNTAAAATKAVEPTRAIAKAAAEHAEGWKASESQVVRFGTGLVGLGLGFSLAGGAAKILHDTISAVVETSTAWERSLVRVGALYGGMAPRIVALSQAQAAIPGVISGQEELLQANTAAAFLTTRYGVSPTLTGRMTGQAAQLSGLFFQNDPGQRQALQDAFREYAQTGGGAGILESTLGRPFDPLSLARGLGYSSEAGLQALTPAQLATARTQLEIANAAEVNIQGSNERRGLLDARRGLDQNLAQAQAALQNRLEGNANDDPRLRALITSETPRNALEAQQQQQQLSELTAREEAYQKAVDAAQAALAANSDALADNERQLKEATANLAKLGVEAGGATAKLLTFAGSLEDPTSIARGDIAAQAQASVAARARMAVPSIGTTQGEIVAGATNNAYQAAYQNYVAQQAQNEQRNAIREELERRVQFGPAAQRPAAARALEQASASEPVYQRLGEAQRASSLVDMRSAETQAGLQQITLTQQERGIQLLRETIDLRRLDVEQQRTGVQVQTDVIRVQQQGLGAQYSLADANYAQQRTQALARQYIGRSLRGQSTAGLPSINDLIQQNVNSQFDIAERTPAALEAGHRVEVAQRTATAVGLGQQLTEGQLQYAQLGTDLKNLGDLPSQTALMLEDLQNSRDQLDVAKDIRELQKDLVKIFTGRGGPSQSGSSQALDELINRVAQALLGDDSAGGNTAPPDAPANRRGPY